MPVPASTYRLQLGPAMTFARAGELLPHVARLGVTHVALSPVLQARDGSTHGYDTTDPTRIRDVLGGEQGWLGFVRAARAHGLGLVLDIVPNHMAASPENAWYSDVVRNGRDSPWAPFFDIDWEHGDADRPYRRFFDVDDLIGVRVEDAGVFHKTHERTLEMLEAPGVDGVRIDHIDGLREPAGYLHALREACPGEARWFVVEKILESSEPLPADWPVEGTTGYDFLNVVTRVQLDAEGLERLDEVYRSFTGDSVALGEVPHAQKRQVLDASFQAEMGWLVRLLSERWPEVDRGALHAALRELMARFPVYRSYLHDGAAPRDEDHRVLESALAAAEAGDPGLDPAALGALRSLLLGADTSDPGREFVARWQQFTPAIMGKGFEDTALYVDLRLTSLNEVGGDVRPPAARLSVDAFHEALVQRARTHPHSMNASSTHDTKRSEDVRARLNVLSEIPDRFGAAVHRWHEANRPLQHDVGGRPCPDPNTEWLLYQTLVGAWPLDDTALEHFPERVKAYLVKATREAKRQTSWLAPDRAWEDGVSAFVDAILDPDAAFRADLLAFVDGLAPFGAWNALAQLALKITAPGIPDVYQGCETWNLSLVDPDNRRPVDFAALADRVEQLQTLEHGLGADALLGELAASWRDGRIKTWATAKLLAFRRDHAALFAEGAHVPLTVRGERAGHVVAFTRRHGPRPVSVVVGRGLARLRLSEAVRDGRADAGAGGGLPAPGALPWGDTRVVFPDGTNLFDVLTGRPVEPSPAGEARLDALLDVLPFVVLEGR